MIKLDRLNRMEGGRQGWRAISRALVMYIHARQYNSDCIDLHGRNNWTATTQWDLICTLEMHFCGTNFSCDTQWTHQCPLAFAELHHPFWYPWLLIEKGYRRIVNLNVNHRICQKLYRRHSYLLFLRNLCNFATFSNIYYRFEFCAKSFVLVGVRQTQHKASYYKISSEVFTGNLQRRHRRKNRTGKLTCFSSIETMT